MALHRDGDDDPIIEVDGPKYTETPPWIMVWITGVYSHVSIRPQDGETFNTRESRSPTHNNEHDIDVPVGIMPEFIEALIDRVLVCPGVPRMALRAVLCDALTKLNGGPTE